MHWLGEGLASLRVGIMSFVGVAWSAFCIVMHFEYRDTPPAAPFGRPGAPEEDAGEEEA